MIPTELRTMITEINSADEINDPNSALYKINYEMMRSATDALHHEIHSHSNEYRYSCSDSTYDYYSNPIYILQFCDMMLTALYECDNTDINNDAFIATYADMINEFLFDAPHITTINDAIDYLRIANDIP